MGSVSELDEPTVQAISMTRIDEEEVYKNYVAPRTYDNNNYGPGYSTLGRKPKSTSYNEGSDFGSTFSINDTFKRYGSVRSFGSSTISKMFSKTKTRPSVFQMEQSFGSVVHLAEPHQEQNSSKLKDVQNKKHIYTKRSKSESYSPSGSFNKHELAKIPYYGRDTAAWVSQVDLRSQGSRGLASQFSYSDDYGLASPHPSHSSAETIIPKDDGTASSSETFTKERVCISDDDDGAEEESFYQSTSSASDYNRPIKSHLYTNSSESSSTRGKANRNLRRRRPCVREKKDGRSRSLTHIDNLDSAMLIRAEDMDSKSEPDTSNDQQQLYVSSGDGENREQNKICDTFQITFLGDLGAEKPRSVPIGQPGTSLGDALRPIFESRKKNIDEVNIYVESSKTPLPDPFSTETYFVAGKNLIVKEKDQYQKYNSNFSNSHSRSFKQSSRKSSNRSTKSSKFFSSSTEEPTYAHCGSAILQSSGSLDPNSIGSPSHHPHHHSSHHHISHEGSLKVKSTKQPNRWSGFFSSSIKDNSKMQLLIENLDSYSKNGIPRPGFLPSDEDENQAIYSSKDDWKDLVPSWMELSERDIQQQTAIWELVKTEDDYLRTVKVITDLFLACLYNLQSSNILNEIDREKLFSNIPEIYKSNNLLWVDCFLPMLQKARDSKQPLDPTELKNGFLQFGVICQPYTRYCLDYSKCQQYCRENDRESEHFKAYLAWCETQKECNRLKLVDILVRPMQRLTKYSLLLKAVLKYTDEFEQRKDLNEMILNVERFVRSVNGAMKNLQDAEKVQAISERIESYDVVETREDELETIVKSYSKLNLFDPMPGCHTARRALLAESDLKIKDSYTSKTDARCLLFTDMLLICKPVGRKGEKMKIIRQPFIIDRLVLRELSRDPCSFGLIYLTEYGTASAALTLHFNEPKLVKGFMDHIKKAQKLYYEAKEKENLEYPDDEVENDMNSKYGRIGSSRASQFSSLIHSHSGSVEMNEASASSRGVSFENELRGSSLSSDDGNGTESSVSCGGANLLKSRSLSTETGPPIGPTGSPRPERKIQKSASPNTLTVQIPNSSLSGQSLPNLPQASDSSPPSTFSHHHHSLTVPKSLLSPTHRGISYPPPSPKSLRRSHAVLPSRNPPLQKSKTIMMSPEKSVSLDVQVPEFRGVIPPSNDASPVVPQIPPPPPSSRGSKIQGKEFNTPNLKHVENDSASSGGLQHDDEDDYLAIHHYHNHPEHYCTPHNTSSAAAPNVNSCANSNVNCGLSKRLARNDRSDTKRFYTTGVIEDMKRESNRDSAIHKRLSWNYGPQQQQQQFPHPSTSIPSSRQFFSSESMTSIRSSSGVSSTNSLLHCTSDLEPCSSCSTRTSSCASTTGKMNNLPPHPAHDPPPPPTTTNSKPLTNVRIALTQPTPTSEVCGLYKNNNPKNDLHDISNHIEEHFLEGKPCRNCSSVTTELFCGANTNCDELNNSNNDKSLHFDKSSGCSSTDGNTADCKSEQYLIRDFILTDASLESSEV